MNKIRALALCELGDINDDDIERFSFPDYYYMQEVEQRMLDDQVRLEQWKAAREAALQSKHE